MMQLRLYSCLILIVISRIFLLQASAFTDPLDVAAILDLYASLGYPPQLKEWRLDGGDPCQEAWTGVACLGSSIIYLKLDGLDLTGNLGSQLYNFYNLKQLDVSSNSITGGIPYSFPPNITHLNLAYNMFDQDVPASLSSLKTLRHLDLSYNNFTGDLPISFVTLANLSELFLQNNQFTGSVALLANLPLTSLNIQDNQFSGAIPRSFQNIANLWFGGNHFDAAGSSIWDFPLPILRNISSPPTTQASALENHPALKVDEPKKKLLGPGGIACFAAGGSFVAIAVTLLITIRVHRYRDQKLRGLPLESSSSSSEIPSVHRLCAEESSETGALPSTRLIPQVQVPPTGAIQMFTRKSFSDKLPSAKVYTLEQLQLATNNFSEERLIGEGSLGSMFRANFLDGQVLALKVINMASVSYTEEDEFFEVTCMAHRLRHPNIVRLVGYCIELGQHILVYEYVKSLPLEAALHSRMHRPLSWIKRLKIALEVARALDYMHRTLSPPVAHGNLKAGNILLDENLTARISDCGLVALRPRTSHSTKLKASEMALRDSGYRTPEHGQPGIEKTKIDVYAFGVLLLELLTGKRPFDSAKPKAEMSLVKWASSRLHDLKSLQQMVDPAIRGTMTTRALSRFADIITLCLQPEKEFRPSISGFVEGLEFLLETARAAEERNEFEPYSRSFRSSNPTFCGSPPMSNLSSEYRL